MNSNEIRYITRFDKEYPKRLALLGNPPAGIYFKGRLPADNEPSVAIVGSRICSVYGRAMAEEFAAGLAKSGINIISGLARGIDGVAQESAVKNGGKTYGVLGCGIDLVYPKQNEKIFEQVLHSGGIISEYPPGRPALPGQFPERNRIISALADIVLVIEAKRRSGTSITVGYALEQGKDVYAVPGRIHDECSLGCNELIANGAGVATSVDDIIEALGVKPALIKPQADFKNMEEAEKLVLGLLDYYPITVEEINIKTNLSIQKVYEILIKLQLKGVCREVSKGQFCRK